MQNAEASMSTSLIQQPLNESKMALLFLLLFRLNDASLCRLRATDTSAKARKEKAMKHRSDCPTQTRFAQLPGVRAFCTCPKEVESFDEAVKQFQQEQARKIATEEFTLTTKIEQTK